MNKEQLIQAIEAKRAEIAEKTESLDTAEKSLLAMENDPAAYFDDELTESFDEFLDELYQDAFDNLPIVVGRGVAPQIIKEEDNIFYRTAYNDWLDDSDNYDLSDFDEYSEQVDLVDSLQSEISDLESELDELLSDLDYLLDEEIQ